MSLQSLPPTEIDPSSDEPKKLDAPIAKRVGRGALWVVGARVIGAGITFLVTAVVLPRVLEPEDVGSYGAMVSAMALGVILCGFGQYEAVVRFVSEAIALNDRIQAQRYVRGAITIVGCGALILAVPLGFVFFWRSRDLGLPFPAPIWLISLLSIGVCAVALQQVGAELLRGFHRIDLASLLSGGQTGGPISNAIFVVMLFGAYLVGVRDLSSVLGLTVISVLLTLPLTAFLLRKTSRRNGNAQGALSGETNVENESASRSRLWKAGLALMAGQLLAFAIAQGDFLIATHVFNGQAEDVDSQTENVDGSTRFVGARAEQSGLYGVARRLMLISAIPVQMASSSILSSIAELRMHGRTRELEKLVRKATTIAAALSAPVIAILCLAPEWILELTTKKAVYAGAVPAIWGLAIGHGALVFFGNPVQAMMMTGKQGVVVIVNGLAAMALFLLAPLLADRYGAGGLAMGASLGLALQNVLLWLLARRMLGIWTHVDVTEIFSAARALLGPRADRNDV